MRQDSGCSWLQARELSCSNFSFAINSLPGLPNPHLSPSFSTSPSIHIETAGLPYRAVVVRMTKDSVSTFFQLPEA